MTLFLVIYMKFQTFHNIVFYLPVCRAGAFGDKKALHQSTHPSTVGKY